MESLLDRIIVAKYLGDKLKLWHKRGRAMLSIFRRI